MQLLQREHRATAIIRARVNVAVRVNSYDLHDLSLHLPLNHLARVASSEISRCGFWSGCRRHPRGRHRRRPVRRQRGCLWLSHCSCVRTDCSCKWLLLPGVRSFRPRYGRQARRRQWLFLCSQHAPTCERLRPRIGQRSCGLRVVGQHRRWLLVIPLLGTPSAPH